MCFKADYTDYEIVFFVLKEHTQQAEAFIYVNYFL
jgi:hypothetical protein